MRFKALLPSLIIFSYTLLTCTQASAQQPGSGNVLSFDGTDDYVNIPNAPSLNPTAAITVEAWINADSWGASQFSNSIVSKDSWANGREIGYVLRCGDNGKLSFNFGTMSDGWQEAVSNSIMSTGQWHHVAGSFDGTTVRVFVDGIEVGTSSYTGVINSSTEDLRIGEIAYNVASRPFDGKIDEVRVWNRALSESVIQDWMCRKITSSHPEYGFLNGYWKLDEGTGMTTSDNSTNTNTGTLTNGPVWGTSGAPIGDVSAHDYSPTPTASLSHPNGDSLLVDGTVGNPKGVQVYRINAAPNVVTLPSGFQSLFTSHYWGVFVIGGTNPTYKATYYYGQHSQVGSINDCKLRLVWRAGNDATSWADLGASQNLTTQSLSKTGQVSREFMLGVRNQGTIANSKNTLCQGDSALINTTPIIGYTYQWLKDQAPIAGATTFRYYAKASGDYQVIVISPSNCNDTSSIVSITVNAVPGLSLNPFSNLCEGAPAFVLTGGMPAGGTYSGTGVSNGSFDPAVADTGTHLITYTFSNGQCTDSISQPIEIFPNPSVSLPTLSSNCINNAAVTLSGGLPSGGTYTGTGVNNSSFDPMVAGIGNHLITYTYTDANSCTDSASQTLEVFNIPTVSISNLNDICANASALNLTGGMPAGGTYTGTGVANNIFAPNTAGPGTYNITYMYTDGNNCSDQAQTTITVDSVPTVSIATTYNDLCANAAPINLTGGMPAGGSYDGPGTSNGTFGPAAAGTGTHNIIYSYTNADGCTATATEPITVNQLPNITLPDFASICGNATPFDLNSGLPAGGDYSGTGVINNQFDPSTVGMGSHQITYTYTDLNNCTNTLTKPIEVFPVPAPPVITLSGDSLISDATGTHQWYDANGQINGATNAYYLPQATGDYYCQVTNIEGCTSESSNTINYTATGIREIVSFDRYFSLAPIPSNGVIHLSSRLELASIKVNIYDIHGKQLMSKQIHTHEIELDLSYWNKGIYLMEIEAVDQIFRRRFILQ